MKAGKKRIRVLCFTAVCTFAMASCNWVGENQSKEPVKEPEASIQTVEDKPVQSQTVTKSKSMVEPSGMTLSERFITPEEYKRDVYKSGSFGEFVRNYPMKKNKAKVHLYDGRVKGNQSSAAAVFTMGLGEQDLQQCADSVMRMYAEYFRQTKQYDRMKFHFVNGFECSYGKWIEGYRVTISGNDVSWVKKAVRDNSQESFEKYLNTVFNYASTLSLEQECKEINFKDVTVGDVFIQAGSPGHVVMVVDVCTNKEGKKAVLLAQGYMPAQEFHVLTNPEHKEDPWYYEDEIRSPFQTAEYTFPDGTCKRPQY